MIPHTISNLIEKFDKNISQLKANNNETQVRVEYLNPFFEELGWDVTNKKYDGIYREVSHEYTIRDEYGNAKKADYCFQSANTPIFFVEAKTPSVNLDRDPKSAYQLRKYGWNAKTGLGILTNFEEFAIYDCRYEPKVSDSSEEARIDYFKFDKYEEKWDEIASLFSRKAVLKGSLNEYIKTLKLSQGILEVDEAFLKEMESWRKMLAENIASLNPDMSQRQINLAVQKTIDRIIFLRICEDRDIEPYGNLQKLQKKKNIYSELTDIYHNADRRYDSGLFYFKQEKSRPEEADELTLKLKIDDKPLKEIINRLYYPAPYAFSIMPADILGQIYERFLGKVIRLDKATRRIDVEDKPEVRKAGGVYYTPTYIVDYIVENTIGKLLEGKTPEQVEKLRFLDPACGSGSFLIRAYQFLLDWHLKYYAGHAAGKNRKGKNAVLMKDAFGNQKLTLDIRRRILINNIFGVDIDPQAVEVTKLSLLLKVLEGEDSLTVSRQLDLFRKRALPDLGKNIKCGNSLIGSDFYQGQQTRFDEEEILKINAFDWESEFAEIMKAGGFDAVIGNPPYGFEFTDEINRYLKAGNMTFVWRGESYAVFVEKALQLLKTKGLLGFIIPDTFLNLGFTESLRTYLLQNSILREIVLLPSKVFLSAVVDTTLLFTKKAKNTNNYHKTFVTVNVFSKKDIITKIEHPKRKFRINTAYWYEHKSFNLQSDKKDILLIDKIEKNSIQLKTVADVFSGVKAYEIGKGIPPQTSETRDTKPFTSTYRKNDDWQPFYDGKDIGRYQLFWNENNWIYYGNWLAAPRNPKHFEGEKILIRKIVAQTLIATYIPYTSYCNTLLFILKIKNNFCSYQHLSGILNSKLIAWYFRKKFQISVEDTFPQIMIRDILEFPILISVTDTKLSDMAGKIIELHKQLAETKLPQAKTVLQLQIDATDRQIDQLVYELYGLTEQDIKIIEDNAAT
jgi:type I restriction-modification system DNA methylase subunit